MSRDHSKQRRNEHLLKNLPTEVLLKARSTLFSLSGALKPKHEQQQPKLTKQELKEKKNHERLKSSRSEPEFSDIRKKHRSRIDDGVNREYVNVSGVRPRPMSLGGSKQYDKDLEDFRCGSFTREASPMPQRNFDSTEEVCLQSRLVVPIGERLSSQDVHMQDVNERPRKKLSFREPEIVISSDRNGNTTLGRSHKLMGVNSLTRRPNRVSMRSEPVSSSLDGLDSDLESQAMRIVRTVGQAFEVCHKMQVNSPEQPAPSTSSAVDEPAPSVSDNAASKEAASECGGSEAAASTTKVIVEEGAGGGKEELTRPSHLDLLPPPPKKESKRNLQRTIPPPSINLPDLPECVTKVDVSIAEAAADANTSLSAKHQLQLLRERLDQQAQQTRAAVAQLLLLRDQLAAETAARCEAQARTHQLLVHNKELLEHIAALVAHLQDRERGAVRSIATHQFTLLPQKPDGGINNANNMDHFIQSNGNRATASSDALIDLFTHTNTAKQNIENNNNSRLSPFSVSPAPELVNGVNSAPCFGGMSNDEIQNYLISKFQDMGIPEDTSPKKFNANQQFYQNCNAFPNIPPLSNHYSAADLASLLNHSTFKEPCPSDHLAPQAQAMSVGQSENSLFSNSQDSSSKESTPDECSSDEGGSGIPFIMPLSHNGTLTATGEDGRVRLIVPVSPSESVSEVGEVAPPTGHTLQVPGRLVAPAAPITRSTSEKVPNRSEMMTALRSQWTRHTTK